MIIDTHIHLPPLGPPRNWDYILAEAGKNGINLLILSHLGDWTAYPAADVVEKANIESKAFADYAGPKALWLAYLNPQLDNWREELETCLKNGASGIKLWISIKDDKGRLENTRKVLAEAQGYNLPVLIHTYNRTDENLLGEITLQEFAGLSCEFPYCSMIAAHSGGHWRQILEAIKKCGKNACFDISGSYPEQGMVESLVRWTGTDRLLFGSDAVGRSFASQKAKVIFADIDRKIKEKIFWENAAKLYKIEHIPALEEYKIGKTKSCKSACLVEEHFCFCGPWPFWKSPCEEPAALNRILEDNGIKKAYTGNLGSFFDLDLLTANRCFAEQCMEQDRILPLATINPDAGNWKKVVIDAMKQNFAGGIITPYLHNWRIDNPVFHEYFDFCADKKFKLWINCELGDYRFRSYKARPVTVSELSAFIKKAPVNQYIFQGVCLESIVRQFGLPNRNSGLFFEFSRITDVQGGMDKVPFRYGNKHLIAGSEFPFRHIKETRYVIQKL
jgi:hypothetical protein